ncbi:MAG: D-tyrosyl-tRNA(Tyr) deacylase [Bacteroidales bacterium]|nr:D-tyrosyl-tRNA(Tyr) deacylase [Bacteroidales bacterium]
MRTIIQRVKSAIVEVDNKIIGKINKGLLILVGFEDDDTPTDIEWIVKKISNLRIFGDNEGKMNLSVKDVNGKILLVSQFTLHASTKKGNRPSFIKAAKPDISIPLYERMIAEFDKETQIITETGKFGAYMNVSLENDGPVTIFIDSKNKE